MKPVSPIRIVSLLTCFFLLVVLPGCRVGPQSPPPTPGVEVISGGEPKIEAPPQVVAKAELPEPRPLQGFSRVPKLEVAAPDFSVVGIFYATDRNTTGQAQPANFYGKDRGILQLGICQVSIPRDHRLGELEVPSILKFEFREVPSKHVVLLSVNAQPLDQFFSNLRHKVDSSKNKEAFVFVHGYNVTFEDAARRTAQLAYDLGFDGAPILYSWPSSGTLGGYPRDETNVEWTVPHLKQFLADVASKSGSQTVHLIAHSMGNRALTAALQQIVDERSGASSLSRFQEIVLTAPDIDAEVFMGLTKAIQKAGKRVTLYVSSKDEALVASKEFHDYPRAGDSGPTIVVAPGVDTIDVSAVDTGLLGHSYFADNRSVLSDLFKLLREGKPPAERFGLRSAERDGKMYWIFRP